MLSILWNKIKRKGGFIVVLRNRFFELLYNFVILRRLWKYFLQFLLEIQKLKT